MKQKPLVMLLPYESCSGLELFGLRFARDLIDRGYHVIVAAPEGSLIAHQCKDREIPHWHFPATVKYDLVSFPACNKMVKELNPVAIVAFRTQMLYSMHAARLLTRQHLPLFLFYRIGAGNYWRIDPIHRRLFNHLTAVVPNADHVRNKIVKYWGINEQKVVCIKSGVDTVKYRPDAERNNVLRQELGLANDAVLIGSSGRIHPEKGSEILLRALFDEQGPGRNRQDVHLLYVGREYQAGYGQHLQKVAAELGVDKRFHILGFRNEVEKVYSSLDLFAFAVTSVEAYAYVVLEAMASGVAPLVPATGGMPEMFSDNVEGFFFKHRDTNSLREKLTLALSLPPGKLKTMGEAARQRITLSASWDMMMLRYLDLFKKSRVEGFCT